MSHVHMGDHCWAPLPHTPPTRARCDLTTLLVTSEGTEDRPGLWQGCLLGPGVSGVGGGSQGQGQGLAVVGPRGMHAGGRG